MWRFFLVCGVVVCTVFYHSCTKDRTISIEICNHIDTLHTYTKSVKTILDSHCATTDCHDAVTASAAIRLDTYLDAVKAVKKHSNFFCAIEFSCVPHMPKNEPEMDTAHINAFYRWRDNCFAK